MTPEEKKEALEIFFSASAVANKFGPMIIEETDGDIRVTVSAASLLMAGFCVQADLSLHSAVEILMASYKEAKEQREEGQ